MTLNAPFAEFEAQMSRETIAHLSNAVATLAGVEVRGIFDEPNTRGDVGMLGMADARPSFTLLTDDIPLPVRIWFADLTDGTLSLPEAEPGAIDLQLVVRGRTYRVSEHEPDGTGMSVLILSHEVAP